MPNGYMSGSQKGAALLAGILILITGFMMLLRIYPFAVPLAMPSGGAGIGSMMAWFWWVIGGVIIPPTMIFFGGYLIYNAIVN